MPVSEWVSKGLAWLAQTVAKRLCPQLYVLSIQRLPNAPHQQEFFFFFKVKIKINFVVKSPTKLHWLSNLGWWVICMQTRMLIQTPGGFIPFRVGIWGFHTWKNWSIATNYFFGILEVKISPQKSYKKEKLLLVGGESHPFFQGGVGAKFWYSKLNMEVLILFFIHFIVILP